MSDRLSKHLKAVFVSLPEFYGQIHADALWVKPDVILTPSLLESLNDRPPIIIDAQRIYTGRLYKQLYQLGYDCYSVVSEEDKSRFFATLPAGRIRVLMGDVTELRVSEAVNRLLTLPVVNGRGRRWLQERIQKKPQTPVVETPKTQRVRMEHKPRPNKRLFPLLAESIECYESVDIKAVEQAGRNARTPKEHDIAAGLHVEFGKQLDAGGDSAGYLAHSEAGDAHRQASRLITANSPRASSYSRTAREKTGLALMSHKPKKIVPLENP